jgi:hypothetical protein
MIVISCPCTISLWSCGHHSLPHTPSSHVLLMPNSNHLTHDISNLMSLITKTKLELFSRLVHVLKDPPIPLLQGFTRCICKLHWSVCVLVLAPCLSYAPTRWQVWQGLLRHLQSKILPRRHVQKGHDSKRCSLVSRGPLQREQWSWCGHPFFCRLSAVRILSRSRIQAWILHLFSGFAFQMRSCLNFWCKHLNCTLYAERAEYSLSVVHFLVMESGTSGCSRTLCIMIHRPTNSCSSTADVILVRSDLIQLPLVSSWRTDLFLRHTSMNRCGTRYLGASRLANCGARSMFCCHCQLWPWWKHWKGDEPCLYMALPFPPKVLDHLPIRAKSILSAKLFQTPLGRVLPIHPNPSAHRRSANSLNSEKIIYYIDRQTEGVRPLVHYS